MPVNTHPFKSEDVMAYLDGELSTETAAEMTVHLTQCRLCQDVAGDLQGVSRQLSGWAVEPFGEGMPENLLRSLDDRAADQEAKKMKPTEHWRFFVHHPWVVVAALVLVAVSALLLPSLRRKNKWMDDDVRYIVSDRERSALAPLPSSMSEFTRLERYANLQKPPDKREAPAPFIVRTAELNVTARKFDTVRTDLNRILLQFGGHIAQLNVASPTNEARNLTATLRVPSAQLDAAMTELRKLGRVNGEAMRGEEVTQQSVDLEARLNNLRHTEERLTEILATRTGKLSDVLEVEQKLSEVRGQIEQAEAEQKSLNNRISFATVQLTAGEDYRAPLTTTAEPAVMTRLSNAAVRGLHNAFNGLLGLLLFILRAGPSVLIFGALLALPGYFLWKHLRHR